MTSSSHTSRRSRNGSNVSTNVNNPVQPEADKAAPPPDDPAMATRANIPYTPQIDGWIQHSPGDVHERLVQYSVGGLGPFSSSSSRTCSTCPLSVGSGSSMTPALIYQSNASAGTPSLYSATLCTDATSTAEESVNTDLIDQGQLASYPVLEEVDGVLVQPLSLARAPVFRCVFWFLNCGYLSQDREEWETHCLSHFHGVEPPCSVLCPLCNWEVSCNSGFDAWQQKMTHLANEHFAFGQNLSTSRPDFKLFNHLWRARLIDDEDLKELNGGNHNLTRLPGNFVRTNGRGTRRERESAVGRQRLQHVHAGQPRHF